MQFQAVRDAIEATLNADAAARYQVIGYQVQATSAEERAIPTVAVYYGSGDFPQSGGSIAGPNKHNATFRLEFTVTANPQGDLATLQDENATQAQLATALATFQNAAREADRLLDQLISDVYGVVMDARNELFGLNVGDVSSRWMGNINKDNPVPKGEVVMLTGNAQLTCTVEEAVLGETGLAGEDIDVVVDIDGDDVEQTGVAGPLGG